MKYYIPKALAEICESEGRDVADAIRQGAQIEIDALTKQTQQLGEPNLSLRILSIKALLDIKPQDLEIE